MRVLFSVLLSLSIILCNPAENSRKLKTTAEIMQVLSSDKFEGRMPGTRGFEKAAGFVEDYLRYLGVRPFFGSSYRDTLNVFSAESYNIVGVIESRRSTDEYILLGAHLDHIGKVINRSPADSVYNGANDNASGVTAVLQIAKKLTGYKFSQKVIIALFTGEESGKWGSEHLAKKLKKAGIQLSYVLNFEMIGAPLSNSPGKVYITGYHRSDLPEIANRLMKENFVLFEEAEIGRGLFYGSDNYPFYLEFKIPSHTISTFDFMNYPYYHQPGDEYSKIDIGHMDLIIDKLAELIRKLLETGAVVTLK
jgi:Zn-dependent M28 family amino/carboxypeptidase